MTERSHITENTKKQPVSTPAQGMFQPRPFVVQRQTEEPEQPDTKTALQRAERYGHRLDRIKSIKPPVPAPIPRIVQAKLAIGQPGDRYEQEADRVAAQVVNQIHAPTTQRQEMPEEDELQMKPEIGTIQREAIPEEDEELQMKPEAGTTQRQELPEEDEELQMQPAVQLQPNGSEMTAQPDLEASIQQARASGQPLADSIKEPMEQAFGADFSGVKVHTDAQSDQLNRSIQARAFTTGQDVFFRQGEYNPGNRGGQELLAHELTHVVQQNGGAVQRQAKKQAEQIGSQSSQNAIQRDPWDRQQSNRERSLEARQNARIEQRATIPGQHPVEIGAEQDGNITRDPERHIDDDMLKTLEVVLNSLPPSHINGNPALSRIVLEHDEGGGASFFGDNKLTIVIPFDAASWVYLNVTKWPLGDLATTLLGSKHQTEFLTRDIVGTGSNLNKLKMVPEKFVEWMLRHETGHSVDKAIRWHDGKHYREAQCAAWEIHEDETLMEQTILNAVGITESDLTNLNNAFNQHTKVGYKSISEAIASQDKGQLNPSDRKAALQAFDKHTNSEKSRLVDYAEKVIRVGLSSPYENGGGVNLNNRTYQRDPQQNEWVSYQSDKYALRNSNYQYQSPGEWFAETYSHYFIPPANKWGEKVNDPAAREWFRDNLDPVNGMGNLIQGGNLVQLPESEFFPEAPQQNADPPPTQTAEALDMLKKVSISIGTVPLSLVTRTLGTTVGTLQLSKIPLQYVYRTIKSRRLG